MSTAQLERRLAQLETEVARLKQKLDGNAAPWWEQVRGGFANDPLYDKAMRLASKYRRAQRPKPTAGRKPR